MTEEEWFGNFGNYDLRKKISWWRQHIGYNLPARKMQRKLRLFTVAWWRTLIPHEEKDEKVAQEIETNLERYSFQRFLTECLDVSYATQGVSNNFPNAQIRGVDLLYEVMGNPFWSLPYGKLCEGCDGVGTYEWGFAPNRILCELCNGAGHISPIWITPQVKNLAEAIYLDKLWGDMPILGDCLEDAGCDVPQILNHCRQEARPHVRGCWVVDYLIGDVDPHE
jgi:hypothetical protein